MSALTAATDLAWLTVAYAAELLRTKKLSPVEYAKALIARSERHDPHYNAYLRATPELALAFYSIMLLCTNWSTSSTMTAGLG